MLCEILAIEISVYATHEETDAVMCMKKNKLRILSACSLCLVVYVVLRTLGAVSNGAVPGSSASVQRLQKALAEHGRQQGPHGYGTDTDRAGQTGKLPTDTFNNKTSLGEVIKKDHVKHKTRQARASLSALTANFSDRVQMYDMTTTTNILHSKRTCVFMKTEFGKTPVCIYNPKTDRLSASIFTSATWQPRLISAIGKILRREPDILFLDFGCNVGVFTLLAAMLDKPVIAVDHSAEHLQLLSEALRISKLRRKVKLIQNVISDVHGNVTLVQSENATRGSLPSTDPISNQFKSNQPLSITVDDFAEPLANMTVFIRMDLGISGWQALQGGRKFFKSVDVKYLAMDWVTYRTYGNGKNVVDFMSEFGLYAQTEDGATLDQTRYDSWPDNIIWRRN